MTENIQRETHPQVRLRNRLLLGAVVALAVVNAVAGYFDIHSSVVIVVCNALGVTVMVAAIWVEFARMIPRKRWRALSFLMPSLGVILLFCARVVDSEGYANATTILLALGGVVIFYGVVCALKWRRYSLARKAQLQEARQSGAEK